MLIKIKDHYFDIEENYFKMESMPDDPANSAVYGTETDGAAVFVMFAPVENGQAMPFDKPDYVISGLHSALADDQGIIEVTSGKTRRGNGFIYSIIKTECEPAGVRYDLTLHIDLVKEIFGLRYTADERGVIGQREALILENAREEKLVGADMKGWRCDPYDPSYKKGALMNFSEQKEFDKLFPDHPLSVLRDFTAYFTAHN